MPRATPKKGRRGTETRKKNYLVTSRYDAEEYEELENASSRAGLTRASYQRVQSLSKPKTRSKRRASIDAQLLGRTLGQLGKIGSNLNQIAHAAHLDPDDHDDLEDALEDLRSLLPVLLSALGRSP